MDKLFSLTDEQLHRKLREAIAARDSHVVASAAAKERSTLKRPNEEGGEGSLITYPSSTNLASKTWHDEKINRINNSIKLYEYEIQRREEKKGAAPPTNSSSAWCKSRPDSVGCIIMGGRRTRKTKGKSSRRYRKKTTRSRKHRRSSSSSSKK